MSVTRMAVFIGIMCSVWMTSPSMANAFEAFVGQSDRGSTRVKSCGDGKGGRESFANRTDLMVELIIDLTNGDPSDGDDGLDGDDGFVAFFRYGGPIPFDDRLFSGVWSKIGDRNGVETYQLTPSGDLAALSTSGWDSLLEFIREEAGDACQTRPPENVFPAPSDLVKGTLVVKKVLDDTNTRKCDASCQAACVGSSCREAQVRLDVKAFMKNDDPEEVEVTPKQGWVRFRYKAKGYVVLDAAP